MNVRVCVDEGGIQISLSPNIHQALGTIGHLKQTSHTISCVMSSLLQTSKEGWGGGVAGGAVSHLWDGVCNDHALSFSLPSLRCQRKAGDNPALLIERERWK